MKFCFTILFSADEEFIETTAFTKYFQRIHIADCFAAILHSFHCDSIPCATISPVCTGRQVDTSFVIMYTYKKVLFLNFCED